MFTLKLLHHDIYSSNESKEWLVFLHGAGGSIQTWKHQIEHFKGDFNILAIDLRDHGSSKNIDPVYHRYNFDIIVSDVYKVLESLAITKAHFVTLSFGSVLMQAIYERHPVKVQSMVLIGGVFNANWMIKGFVHLARFFNLFLSFPTMYRVFSYLLMPKKNHQVARRVYQMQARQLTSEEYLKWLGLYSEFFLLLRSFNRQLLSIPALILMGSEDYLFLPSAQRFALNHKESELKKIHQAGHICNIEKPKETNQAIEYFLNDHTTREEKQSTKLQFDTN